MDQFSCNDTALYSLQLLTVLDIKFFGGEGEGDRGDVRMLDKVCQGRIQDFQIEGAQKIMCTRRTASRARDAKSLTAGPYGSRVLYDLSCY